MDEHKEYRRYLKEIERELKDQEKFTKKCIIEEIKQHLSEKIEETKASSQTEQLSEDEIKSILEEFGEPSEIAKEYKRLLTEDGKKIELYPKNVRSWITEKNKTSPIIIIIVTVLIFYFLVGSYGFDNYWEKEAIDKQSNSEFDSVLSFDSTNSPHILYIDYDYSDGSKLKYASKNEDSWVSEVILSYEIRTISMVIDKNDSPHISCGYYEDTNDSEFPRKYSLLYLKRVNGTWNEEVLDSVLTRGYSGYNNIEIYHDLQNNPHIKYERSNSLYYAKKVNGNWSSECIGYLGNYGESSMDLDSNGYPHIFYMEEYGESYHIWWDGFNWESENLSNIIGYIDYDPVIIKVDARNFPHMVFNINYSLRHLFWNGVEWNITEISEHRSSYQMVLDTDGNPHIFYMEEYDENYHIWWEEEINKEDMKLSGGSARSFVYDEGSELHVILHSIQGKYVQMGQLFYLSEKSSLSFYPFYGMFIFIIAVCGYYLVKK